MILPSYLLDAAVPREFPAAVAAAELPPEHAKAPFPYFGGKTTAAAEVWASLADVKNYVEPFAGSLGVLLNRPSPIRGPETVNDLSCHLVNVWRAIQARPDDLAQLLIAPVAEVNTEAQHNALIQSTTTLRERQGDPGYCDLAQAAWWVKGANEWIGSGWCGGEGPWAWTTAEGWYNLRKLPHLGNAGTGVNRQLPHLGSAGAGVNRQLPHLGDAGTGAYAQRVEWLSQWLCALRDRLCSVRIACGDWQRVCGPSVTTKHGLTGVFLDPPYEGTEYVYGASTSVSSSVRDWCVSNGVDPKLRIVLAGRGEEHDSLLGHGWSKKIWSAKRGYSKTDLRTTEALWCSPHCVATNPQ